MLCSSPPAPTTLPAVPVLVSRRDRALRAGREGAAVGDEGERLAEAFLAVGGEEEGEAPDLAADRAGGVGGEIGAVRVVVAEGLQRLGLLQRRLELARACAW